MLSASRARPDIWSAFQKRFQRFGMEDERHPHRVQLRALSAAFEHLCSNFPFEQSDAARQPGLRDAQGGRGGTERAVPCDSEEIKKRYTQYFRV